jgi:hypothetical protein
MSKSRIEIDVLAQYQIDELFLESCESGDLDTIKYLFTSPNIFYRPDIYYTDDNFHDCLTLAASNDHLEVVKYLLYSNDLNENPMFSRNHYGYLSFICESEQFDMADYLREKEIFDPIEAFIETHKEATKPNLLSQYLIINCNIPITDEIKEMISDKPLIAQIFEKRELNKELREKLDISDDTNKKFKI